MSDLIDTTDVLPLRLPGRSGPRPRTVLVLGGGGMRGMAHIGVLKALQTLELVSVLATCILLQPTKTI